jgi:hypothetical protein
VRTAPHPNDQPQRQSAREQSQGSETGGIDSGVFQGHATQQRVARKSHHRQHGQQDNAARRNRNPTVDRPCVSVLDEETPSNIRQEGAGDAGKVTIGLRN